MWVLIFNTYFTTAEPRHFEVQKFSYKRIFFEKGSLLHRIRTWDYKTWEYWLNWCTIRPQRQVLKENWWICNLYDLECVDDQQSNGKSVWKYLMGNRLNQIVGKLLGGKESKKVSFELALQFCSNKVNSNDLAVHIFLLQKCTHYTHVFKPIYTYWTFEYI